MSSRKDLYRDPAPRVSVFDSLLGMGEAAASEAREISLERVDFSSSQPRRFLSAEALAKLVASIREKGVLQPILVRPRGDRFELVAGERRVRAARLAELKVIPAVVRELDDTEAFELALIENLAREDLNPADETDALLRLLSLRLERPVEEVSSLLYRMHNEDKGKVTLNVLGNERGLVEGVFGAYCRYSWQTFVTTRLPILKFPDDVLAAVREGRLEYTKARTLASVRDASLRLELLRRTLDEELSLSSIRRAIREQGGGEQRPMSLLANVKRQLNVKRLERLPDEKKVRVQKLLAELEGLLNG
jgi:ParB family transcriptional regulator, chromosome partitioning protein